MFVAAAAAAAVALVAAPPAALQTGDLLFLSPRMDPRSPLDNAILATGAATISWLRAHSVPVAGNETAGHVALALRNSSGLFFVQALPPVVEVTAAADFWHSTMPTTTFYRGWLTDSVQRKSLAAAAVRAASTQVGKPYAHDFEPPPGEFYCSSLVVWAYKKAAGGKHVFLPPPLHFTLLFSPLAFWENYYRGMNMSVPVNVSGSNPTLVLHSPAVSFEKLSPH